MSKLIKVCYSNERDAMCSDSTAFSLPIMLLSTDFKFLNSSPRNYQWDALSHASVRHPLPGPCRPPSDIAKAGRAIGCITRQSTLLSRNVAIRRNLAMPASVSSSEVLLRRGSVLVSVLLLAGYHVRLWRREHQGVATWRSTQARTREEWAKFVRNKEQWLYAIQTLRNAITANTFLATTVLSLLTVISGKLWEMVRNLHSGSAERNLLTVQFASTALCMLMSAYEFLQSARLMTHAGFMFPVSPGKTTVDAIMRKSQSAQWFGLRYLYVSLSFIFWTIGGERGFLLSSIALVQFFERIDRVPKGLNDD